jgi:hypothetical protein
MEDIEKRRQDRWNSLFIAGMWFQDLFNYDSVAPSDASFRMRRRRARSASAPPTPVAEHHREDAGNEEHGRHEIFASGKKVGLDTTDHTLKLDAEAVGKGKQTDLDEKGIARRRATRRPAQRHRV